MVTPEAAERPRLAVVVPALNEAHEHGILRTLEALHAQEDDDFDLVVVDNGSTDGTPDVVRKAIAEWGRLRWHVVAEAQKGTGAAADTGMRAAIGLGAELLACPFRGSSRACCRSRCGHRARSARSARATRTRATSGRT
jgi:glycosyltransferase involved in cell wall biosynthesis